MCRRYYAGLSAKPNNTVPIEENPANEEWSVENPEGRGRMLLWGAFEWWTRRSSERVPIVNASER